MVDLSERRRIKLLPGSEEKEVRFFMFKFGSAAKFWAKHGTRKRNDDQSAANRSHFGLAIRCLASSDVMLTVSKCECMYVCVCAFRWLGW